MFDTSQHVPNTSTRETARVHGASHMTPDLGRRWNLYDIDMTLHWRELAEPTGGAGTDGRAPPAGPQLAEVPSLRT